MELKKAVAVHFCKKIETNQFITEDKSSENSNSKNGVTPEEKLYLIMDVEDDEDEKKENNSKDKENSKRNMPIDLYITFEDKIESINSFLKKQTAIFIGISIIVISQSLFLIYMGKKIENIQKKEKEILSKQAFFIKQKVEEIDNTVSNVKSYLASEGKVVEVLSKIIMTGDVKLNKIIEGIYSSRYRTQNIDTLTGKKTESEDKARKIEKEIKKESDDLIKKYENLLKELQNQSN